MITISILNQKGGVGKTSSAVNIASELALKNYQTLLIDLDSQGNASMYLDREVNNLRLKTTIFHLITQENTMNNILINTNIKNLDIIPSNSHLGAADAVMATMTNKEQILKNIVNSVKKKYDFIIIDCPPALGALSINALIASDHIIIPMQCEEFALKGLKNLINTIKIMGRHQFNNNLSILGILITMYDPRSNLTKNIYDELKNTLQAFLFDTKIPKNIKIAEACSKKKPVNIAFPNSPGAIAYSLLVKEILNKLT